MRSRKLTAAKPYHLVFYVENCSSQVKKFYDKKRMKKFVQDFLSAYPDREAADTGYWIDCTITDIKGQYKNWVGVNG